RVLGPEGRAFVAALPPTRTLETIAGPLLLCHGLGTDDMAGVWPHDQGYALEVNLALYKLLRSAENRFVVNGHTHHRMLRRFDSLTIVNAGTLRRGHDPCFLLVDLRDRFVDAFDLSDPTRVAPPSRLAPD